MCCSRAGRAPARHRCGCGPTRRRPATPPIPIAARRRGSSSRAWPGCRNRPCPHWMRHEPSRSYQVRRILRRFHVQSVTEAVVTLALLVSYPLLLVIAALPTDTDDRLPWGWLFLAVVAASYLAEAWAPRVTPYLVGTLNWLQVGILLRWVFREVALLILLARALPLTPLEFAAFALGLLALHAIRAGLLGAGDLRGPAQAAAGDHPQRGPGLAADPGPPAAAARRGPRQDDPVPRHAAGGGRPGGGHNGRLRVGARGDRPGARRGPGLLRDHGWSCPPQPAPRLRHQGPRHRARADPRVPPGGGALLQRVDRLRLPGQHVAFHRRPAGPASHDHHA